MRLLVLLLVSLSLPTLALARDGQMGRFRVGGFYGYASLPAGDLNNYINGVSSTTTPKWGNLANAFNYGGEFGFMLKPRLELVLGYEQQWANNPVTQTAPSSVRNAGVEVSMNAGFGGLNFYFLDKGALVIGLGARAGYPTLAHASVISSTRTEYDAAFMPLAQGLVVGHLMLGKRFSFDLQGGYQYALLGALTSGSAAQNLKTTTNTNVNLDMSGWRGKAGLSFYF